MYWLMGQRSEQEIFKNIRKIGIFNPRQNVVYQLNTDDIDPNIRIKVERDIICYPTIFPGLPFSYSKS